MKSNSQIRQMQAVRSINVLVVADIGASHDHVSEPRYPISLDVDFTPSNRSSVRQLETIIKGVKWQLPSGMHQDAIHVWLLDDNGVPSLFLTGLLAVRKSEMTRSEMETLNNYLVPQVTCEQPEFKFNLLVRAYVDVSSYDWDVEDYDGETEDLEYEVFYESCGHFVHSELTDSYSDDGVYVSAYVWQKLEFELPFDSSKEMSLSQLRYVRAKADEAITESIDSNFEFDVFDIQLWMTDSTGESSRYLTGLLEVLEGKLSKRKLKKETELARQMIPHELLASTQAV